MCSLARFDLANRGMRQSTQHTYARLLAFDETGAELGGFHCPPKFCLASPNFSGLFLKVLHRPLTAPLVAKLATPVPPPNENVWLRPCDETLAQPDLAVVNCSDVVRSVFYSPVLTCNLIFLQLWTAVVALSLFSSDILTWSADIIYIQCNDA